MKNLNLFSFYFCLIVYYFFFWEENLGINLLIFNTLIISIISVNLPKNRKTIAIVSAALLSSLAVVLINTVLGKFINLLVMSVLFGYSVLPTINSALSAGLVFFTSLLLSIKNITEPITQIFKDLAPRNVILKKALNILKISILPLLLFFIFLLIFQNANPIFEEKTVFLQNLITLFLKKFPTFSFGRTMFTLVGFIFLNAVFFRKEIFFGLDLLTNQEIKLQPSTEPASNSKFQTAFLTLILLNLLLVFVNAIDIKYLWFNFENTTAPEMSKLVHSGTYLLIFSVLLSILVLIFFFKGDLNFHKKNKWVSILSFAWIGQNILLLFSVYIRNYKYIEMYGLTHKRIGVIIFLIVTLIGLITMVLKIYKKLNIRFLFISNSWAFMTLLLILSFVNFDKIIAINNLKRTDCDMDYIKSLSVRVLPIVKKHHPEFNEDGMFAYKYYKQQQNRYTWLSWNLADHKLNGYINSKLLTSE